MQVKRKMLRSSTAALAFALLITGTLAPTGTLRAQNAATTQETITPLITKDLAGSAGEQVLMYTVDFPPGFASPIHRHNAQVSVYVLDGSVVMQVRGQKEVTLRPGQSFYEPLPIFIPLAVTPAIQSRQNFWCS
jgi:quercetin dioxygenase-like cupin family protein